MFFYSLHIYKTFRTNQSYRLLLTSLVLGTIFFLIYNGHSLSLLRYQPFWFTNSMIESPDRLYLPQLANMRYSLESANRIGPRLILLQTVTLAIFIIGNFGWRLLGFITSRSKNLSIQIIFNLLALFTIIIPTLFIQKGTSWNTIQFLYYGLFLTNFTLVIFIYSRPHLLSKFISVVIIIINIFPLIGSTPQYLGKIPPTAIPPSEIKALNYLSQQPAGTVLTVPYDAYLKTSITTKPLPLYAYETTGYVSAYSHHSTFLEDEMNLGNSGLNYQPILDDAKKFFRQQNKYQDRGFLVNNQISYIYLTGKQIENNLLNQNDLSLETIYNQDENLIYRVLR